MNKSREISERKIRNMPAIEGIREEEEQANNAKSGERS